jgi:Ca2+-binding RTX toxin-like protein
MSYCERAVNLSYLPPKWKLNDLIVAADLARASYENESSPAGWDFYDLRALKIKLKSDEISSNGIYYTTDANWLSDDANACVLVRGKNIAVSFRGTEDFGDKLDWPKTLKEHSYIDLFSKLLKSVHETFGDAYHYIFTGHSLGGAAVDQLASAAKKYGFKDYDLFTFASPIVDKGNIHHFGFDNDLVYEFVYGGNGSNNNNNTFIVNDQSDVDYLQIPDTTAHDKYGYVDVLKRLKDFKFYDDINFNDYLFAINTSSPIDIDNSFSGYIYVLGGKGADNIVATNGNDRIDLSSGGDSVAAEGGRDIVYGGADNDTIAGGVGNDIIFGDSGDDYLIGDAGIDVIRGGSGNDRFLFVAGDVASGELIDGGSAKGEMNTITSVGTGKVDFTGAKISNIGALQIGNGMEFHFSDAQIRAFIKTDALFSGSGNLLIDANGTKQDYSVMEPHIAQLTGALILSGMKKSDNLVGTSHTDWTYGQGGNDTIHGGGNADVVVGGAGKDKLYGDGGNDTFIIDASDIAEGDSIDGGAGTDALKWASAGSISIHLTGQTADLNGFSGTSIEQFSGSDGNDVIQVNFDDFQRSVTVLGGGGDDVIYSTWSLVDFYKDCVLDGGAGKDRIVGGSGREILVGRDAGDILEGGAWDDFELYAEGVQLICDLGAGSQSDATFHYNGAFDLSQTNISYGYFAEGVTSFTLKNNAQGTWPIQLHLSNSGVALTLENCNPDLIYCGTGNDTFTFKGTSLGASLWDFETGHDKIRLSNVAAAISTASDAYDSFIDSHIGQTVAVIGSHGISVGVASKEYEDGDSSIPPHWVYYIEPAYGIGYHEIGGKTVQVSDLVLI